MKKIISALAILAIISTMAVVMGQDKPAPIKGTVLSVNDEEKSFTLNFKDEEFTVKTSEKTKFLKDMEPAGFDIVEADAEVTIIGKVDKEEKTINAMIIAVGKFEKPGDMPKPDFTAFGKVSNIGENTFTLENDKGTVTVNTSEKTKFASREGKKSFADLEDGAEVTVVGMLDKETKTVKAMLVFWGKKEDDRGGEGGDKPRPIIGKASNVNVSEGTFTLTNDKGEITVKTSEETKIMPEGKTLADIPDGETVGVLGKFNEEDKTLEAKLVFIGKKEDDRGGEGGDKPRPIIGKASNVNASEGTFTLTNDKGEITVKTSEETKFMPEGKTLADIPDGETVGVLGKFNEEDKTLEAKLVFIGKPEKGDGPRPVVGKASNIDKSAMSFTLTAEDGKTVTVAWSEKTKFFLGKEVKSADDLEDGATVAVIGKLDGETLNAILVSLDGKLPKKP